jgi:glycosyltransferase involved in cell wall biosynthesis
MQDTIVVVPCYNEADRFQAAPFADAVAAGNLRFILVDDGSTDGTRDMLEALARELHPRITLLALDENHGKAEAVRRGISAALLQSPRLVAYLDADLATPISELDGMCSLLDARPELHVVLGSRVALLGRDISRSQVRHYLGRVFATAASLTLSLTVYDTQCGAKVFRNTAAVRSVFAQPFLSRWIFDVEILARLEALALEGLLPSLDRSAAEYPLLHWRDVSGSKVRPAAAAGASVELLRIWMRYRKGWQR